MWIYGILFVIIFIETGLVVMPLLPGDSLLFVAGSLAGSGYLNIVRVLCILFGAAVL
jgi:membrane-associated protein